MRIPTIATVNRIHAKCRGAKKDAHKEVAAWMYEIPVKQVMPAQREAAKMFSLAAMYGPEHKPPARTSLNAYIQAHELYAPWRTRDGRSISLEQMSTAHLHNSLAMLERRCAALHVELAKRQGSQLNVSEEEMASWDPRDDFSPGVW